MNPTSSQTAKFADKREALIAWASELLNEHGIRGTTLSAVAEGVGLVKNSVTYYFRRKEDLASTCYLRAIEVFNRLTEQAMDEVGLHDRLLALLQLHADLLMAVEQGRHPTVARFHDLRALGSPHKETVFVAYTDMFRRLRRLLADDWTTDEGTDGAGGATRAGGAGDCRNANNARAHLVLAVINAQRVWLQRHEPVRYRVVAGNMHGLLMNGLMSPGARWRSQGAEAHWQLGSAVQSPSDAFLRTATQLINEQGYCGASVNRISERLNMTKGGFYYHNETKGDLVSCCFEQTFSIISHALSQAEEDSALGWEKLGAVLRALVLLQLLPDGIPLLQWSAVAALPDAGERVRIRTAMGRVAERLSSLVVAGMVDGSIRPLDPMQAAQLVMVGINAVADLPSFVPGTTPRMAIELYARPLLMGLRQGRA